MPWTAAATSAAFAGRDVIAVECRGRRLALYRVHDQIFATNDACPHQGASLSAGCVVGGYIECPLHYALFDVRTGEADGSVTTTPVRTFATKVEGDVIYVDLPGLEENGQ
jgi:nitrite reductase/ring-hydroxylating ferredoxin subunit